MHAHTHTHTHTPFVKHIYTHAHTGDRYEKEKEEDGPQHQAVCTTASVVVLHGLQELHYGPLIQQTLTVDYAAKQTPSYGLNKPSPWTTHLNKLSL